MGLSQKTASLSDIKDIWGLTRQSAADIPALIESEADQERALTAIMECCTAELSPIVVDEKKEIVGVLLAKRDQFDWGFRNMETLNVSLAAVSSAYRDKDIFKLLLEGVTKKAAPVFISVKAGDGQGLTDELKRFGFQLENTGANSELYKWEAPAQAA